MSYSNLVSYVKLSPNCSARSGAPIDHIVIHHAAGNASVEALGALFADPARQASATYGVGSDGRIACFVKEQYRPWTSSNVVDDHAITIEVANDGGPNWHVSDAALESTIELCVDVCQRYGFRLNFTGDTTGNLTMHKYYISTACPGPYLASKFPYIAEEVNRRLDEAGELPVEDKPAEQKPDYQLGMRLLVQGCEGEDVRALQILLEGRGYGCGEAGADRIFGEDTHRAVCQFQREHGLVEDGIVGPDTMGALMGV